MFKPTDENDYGMFCRIFEVLTAFADRPETTIGRICGGRISIPDDLANELHYRRQYVLEKYPAARELELMQVVDQIDEILTRYSGDDDWFWKNAGYLRHPDWDTIRDLARGFLMR